MTIIAKASRTQGDQVIPIPFDFVPSQMEPDNQKDIIVAIADVNDGKIISQKVYKYYGKENCQTMVAHLPGLNSSKRLYCVSSNCILSKINDLEGELPDADISPVWTEAKYGISANEAVMLTDLDKKTKQKIKKESMKVLKKLDKLQIPMNDIVLGLIKDCRELIDQARVYEEAASKECREDAAKEIARFMERNFPVKAWVEKMVEPIVAFIVIEKDDDRAYIIGQAIDQIMNDIEPEDSQKFFDVFVYDACSWPVIVNRTFDEDGTRQTYPKEL